VKPTWTVVGPILAQKYTVIAIDLRGMGDSSIPFSYNFTASAAGADIKAVLDFLHINQTYIFGHDKGSGVAAAFTAQNRQMVKRIGISEYAFPGFGYETTQSPLSTWNLYSNWQLAFFSVPDAAQFFVQGKERQMLEWYFFHSSYSGGFAFSNDMVTTYTDSISKPGFLRAMFEYFSNPTVAQDAAFFTQTFSASKLQMPVLSLGGEASLSTKAIQQQIFQSMAENLTVDVVPKAGHWIGRS
jgi:pimeloyl-ACP methyl ester carboxylesterase